MLLPVGLLSLDHVHCNNSVQYMITLSSCSGDTIGPAMTSDTSYIFNNTVMLTGDLSVSVIALDENIMGTRILAASQPSSLSKKFVERLFSTN